VPVDVVVGGDDVGNGASIAHAHIDVAAVDRCAVKTRKRVVPARKEEAKRTAGFLRHSVLIPANEEIASNVNAGVIFRCQTIGVKHGQAGNDAGNRHRRVRTRSRRRLVAGNVNRLPSRNPCHRSGRASGRQGVDPAAKEICFSRSGVSFAPRYRRRRKPSGPPHWRWIRHIKPVQGGSVENEFAPMPTGRLLVTVSVAVSIVASCPQLVWPRRLGKHVDLLAIAASYHQTGVVRFVPAGTVSRIRRQARDVQTADRCCPPGWPRKASAIWSLRSAIGLRPLKPCCYAHVQSRIYGRLPNFRAESLPHTPHCSG